MKATNTGDRTIILTNLPTTLFEEGRQPLTGLPSTVTITVNYVETDGDRLHKAISLDNVIIPAIVEALNRKKRKKKPLPSAKSANE